MMTFTEEEMKMRSNISAYSGGQSTVHVLKSISDNIITAMKRREVTMMILTTDVSKAFDTTKFKNLIEKINHLGFSKSFLKWTLSYVSKGKQLVQIDEKLSNATETNFEAPQRSIRGSALFNTYVAYLQSDMKMRSYQYADDTTLYCQKVLNS